MDSEREKQLAAFMRRALNEPFRWGVNDCCATVDEWCKLRTGRSPINAVYESYDNETAANEIIERRGGVARMVSGAMRSAKIPKTRDPQNGDVGVVKMLGRVCAAIKLGNIWTARDKTGMLATASPDRIVAAWRID